MPSTLADAIAKLEGYGAGNNIPTVANNPGNLELGDIGFGTLNAANGNKITIFGSVQDGWTALENQLTKIVSGNSAYYKPDTTLAQFGKTYSGSPTYGNDLASALGTSPTTSVADAYQLPSDLPLLNVPGMTGQQATQYETGIKQAETAAKLFDGFTTTRFIVLVIGVLLFGAGLFSFKQTQIVLQTAAEAAKVAA